MKPKNKMLRGFLLIGGVLLGLLLLLAAGIVIFLKTRPTEEAYDDSHLMRPHEQIADELNAFTYYEQAAKLLRAYMSSDERIKIEEVIQGTTEWDEGFVESVLSQNATALQLIEKGNECERCLLPRVTANSHMPVCLWPWMSGLELFELRIAQRCRVGDYDAAVADVSSMLNFTHKLNEDAADITCYLMSAEQFESVLLISRKLVCNGKLSEMQLAHLMNILEQHAPTRRGFILSCQTEYETSITTSDGLLSGDSEFWESIGTDTPPWYQKLGMKIMFSPNDFRTSFGELFTEIMEQVQLPYAKTSFPIRERMAAVSESSWNPSKKVASMVALNITGTLHISHCYMPEANYHATGIIVALKQYKLKHGDLPPDLESLVPDFLDAVPADPFDGKPMRYNAEKGLVYSVGEDLIDSGGSTKQRNTRGPSRRNAEDYMFGVSHELKFKGSK